MDGTLTIPMHDFEAFRRRAGLQPGEPILEAIETRPPAVAAQLHEALNAWEWSLAGKARAALGARALLDTLLARGVRLGVLTRNRRDIALETLRVAGLADAFAPSVVLGRDSAAPKPAPDGIWDVLRRLDRSADEAVMVGDYVHDIEAGRAAGVLSVHVHPDPARGTGAHLGCGSLTELLARLQHRGVER
jgi:HAD superfamily hydrolase (TIGR01509 family)